MTGRPLFSIITPSLNQARFLRRNIESGLEQGVDDLEHIVVDGGSTDGTLDILKGYGHLQWISEPDRGQSDALNKGIARARGEWIVWLNSDDYLLPGALRTLRAFLAEHPDARFVYSNLVYVDEENNEIQRRRASYSRERETLYYWWRSGGVGFPQPGTFFRKSLWSLYGPFDVDLHYTMDFSFWLRLSDSVKFHHLDDWLAAYRLHGEAKTAEGWRPFVEEHMRVTRRYWDSRPGWRKWEFRLRLRLVYGSQVMAEGVRMGGMGHHREARRLMLEGALRNPLSLLGRTHLRYRLRQLLGERRHRALAARFPALGGIDPAADRAPGRGSGGKERD